MRELLIANHPKGRLFQLEGERTQTPFTGLSWKNFLQWTGTFTRPKPFILSAIQEPRFLGSLFKLQNRACLNNHAFHKPHVPKNPSEKQEPRHGLH